jgi:hypothetical protein
MLELVKGFPDHVVAVRAIAQVTRDDYHTVLVPAVEGALQHHAKLRLYYMIGHEFTGFDPGAAWEDFKVGMEHLTRWERIAVVTDVDWMQHTIKAFGFVMPGEMRVFPSANDAEARTWIASG